MVVVSLIFIFSCFLISNPQFGKVEGDVFNLRQTQKPKSKTDSITYLALESTLNNQFQQSESYIFQIDTTFIALEFISLINRFNLGKLPPTNYNIKYASSKDTLELKKTMAMRILDFDYPIVTLKLASKYHLFLIDSGFLESIIDTNKIDINQLDGEKVQYHGVEYIELDKFKMGNVLIYDKLFELNSMNFSINKGLFKGVSGIIGWDILHKLDFTVDNLQNYFIIDSLSLNKDRFDYYPIVSGPKPHIFLQSDIIDNTLCFIDLGSDISWGTKNLLAHFTEEKKLNKSLRLQVFNRKLKLNYTIDQDFKILFNNSKLDFNVHLLSDKNSKFPKHDIILGNDFFKGKIIHFKNSSKEIGFTDN